MMTKIEKYPIAQAIRERRSIRKFKSKDVSADLIIELLDDAVWAPNHKLREPWRFIAYIGEGRKQLVEAIMKVPDIGGKVEMEPKLRQEYLLSIPCYIVVVMREDPRAKIWEEDYAGVCTLIQNFQLTAWERGLGVVWKTGEFISLPKLREAIGVVPGEKIVGLLYVGYPEIVPDAHPRTPARGKLTLIDGINATPISENLI